MKSALIASVSLIAVLWPVAITAVNPGEMTKSGTENSGRTESWTPGICFREFPLYLRKDFPVYLSGYDYENRPVVFWLLGSFQFRKWSDGNDTTRELSAAYFEHIWCRMHNLTSPFEDAEEGILMVLDSGGLKPSEFYSVEVTKMNLAHMRLGERYSDNIAEIVVINTNLVTNTWIEAIRPVAGRLFGSMELAGSRKERWLPILRGKMDNSVIPPWITGEEGSRDYKPLEVW